MINLNILDPTIIKQATEVIPVVVKEMPDDAWSFNFGTLLGILIPLVTSVLLYMHPLWSQRRKDIVKTSHLRTDILILLARIKNAIKFEVSIIEDNIQYIKQNATSTYTVQPSPSLNIDEWKFTSNSEKKDGLVLFIYLHDETPINSIEGNTDTLPELILKDNDSTINQRMVEFYNLHSVIQNVDRTHIQELIFFENLRIENEKYDSLLSEAYTKVYDLIYNLGLREPQKNYAIKLTAILASLQSSVKMGKTASMNDLLDTFINPCFDVLNPINIHEIEKHAALNEIRQNLFKFTDNFYNWRTFRTNSITELKRQLLIYNTHAEYIDKYLAKQLKYEIYIPKYLFLKRG